jgi:heat shock protein HslJ
MKLFLAVITIISVSQLSALSEKNTNEQKSKKSHEKLKIIEKEEDCDEKAKKVIEIKPESISLGGNTGCTLEESN